MSERTLRFRLGLFVVIAMILLAAMVILFGSLPGLFRNSKHYVVRFADARGIAVGTPVQRSGVRVGEVSDLKLDRDRGDVLVTVALDPNFVVHRNEEPTLIAGLLGPDATIDFVPREQQKDQPPPDTSVVPPGGELAGRNLTSVNTLINRASEVVPATQETLDKISKSMEVIQKSVNDLTPVAKRTMEQGEKTFKRYEELATDLQKQIPALRASNDEFLKLAKTANESLPRLEKSLRDTSDDIGATARVWQRTGERVNVFLEKNQDQLDSIVRSLNEVLTGASKLFTDENQRNINRTLKNLGSASENLEPLTRNANEFLKESRGTLSRLDEVLVAVNKVTKPLIESGPRIVRNLDESLDKVNKSMTDVQALVRAIGSSNGTLYKILYDPSLYNRIDESLCQAMKLIPRVDRILKDFETFSDKLAKHPELLGVRGVISPSNGVKDPP